MRDVSASVRTSGTFPVAGLTLVLLASVLAGVAARAGEPFPFLIPGLDGSPSPTNLSSLGERPAGKTGHPGIKDGHFVDGHGRRLRLLGVNFSFGANFPEPADAEKIAAHLAKLGINAVRHHHMDARDIWHRQPGERRELDPVKLDKLAYLIAQLAKNGIYSNLNLHVSRSVTVAEGFPDARELPRYNKWVLYIDERLQKLLRDYARDLLTYESPHTGRRLADEPSLVTVEITNENRFSLTGIRELASLPERYRDEFRRRWNAWLRAKYSTIDALQRAWGASAEPLGDDVAGATDFARGSERWSLTVRGGNRARFVTGEPGPEREPGIAAAHVAIEAVDGVIHQLELVRRGLTLKKDRLYTLSFWIRAAKPRTVHVDVSRDGDPWNTVGLGERLKVTTDWQHVVRPFRATATLEGRARWIFKLGDDASDLWIAAPRIRHGGRLLVFDPEASLEKGTIPVPSSTLQKPVARDLRAFMEETERAFFAQMYQFLKKEIGVKAPITGSQVRWQALSAFAPLDFLDAHAYWEHPRFPRRSWDPRDWNIPNRSMVRSPGSDTLTRLAWYRARGRPYTISEYNHPAPNDYQAECLPLFAAFAALQDWDGIYLYSYQHGGGDWSGEKIQRFFDINGNPAKLGLLPTGAMLFRRGDVKPAREERTASAVVSVRLERETALEHRVGTELDGEAVVRDLADTGERTFTSDTGEIHWDAEDSRRARFLVDTPRTKLVVGFIAEDEIQIGGLRLKTGSVSRNFGVVSLTSLDGEALADSRRMLLTSLANAENSGMVWNEDRTSVSDRWGSSPPMVEIVPAEVTLRRAKDDTRVWKLFALDPTGQRRRAVPVDRDSAGVRFRVDPADQTIWYELVSE